MADEIECSFFVPMRRDQNLSDGDLHAPEAWQWLDAVLFSAFGGRTIAPGFYDGIYIDPDTGERIPDACRRYIVAVPQSDVPQLRRAACDRVHGLSTEMYLPQRRRARGVYWSQ